MNRKIILLFIFSISVLVSCETERNNTKNEIKRNNFYGKVKSVRTIQYLVDEKFGGLKKGEIMTDGYGNDYDVFNKKGEKKENISYNKDGTIEYQTIYKYDDNGKCIQYEKFNSLGGSEYKVIIEFDGNKTKSFVYKSDGSLNYWFFRVSDNKGNEIESKKFDSNYNLIEREINTLKYDDNDNIIERINYESSGEIHVVYRYKFDIKNNLLEEVMFDSNGTVKWKNNYKYDDRGNKIEYISYSFNEYLKLSNEYKIIYQYDEFGNVTEYVKYKPTGEIIDKYNTKYTYDKKNNWIKKIGSSEGFPNSLNERTIEYF